MQSRSDSPILLTVREVSLLLRVQRPKVYDLIKDGVVDGFKVGADWRVRRDSVEKLIGLIPEQFFIDAGMEEEDEKPMEREMSNRPMPSIMQR
jgi:excisionase family DNA binding protein